MRVGWQVAALALCIPFCGCGEKTNGGLCPDDGDSLGPACSVDIQSAAEFETLSVEQTYILHSDRFTRYMAPAGDDTGLLPVVLQNVNRYQEHIGFLRAVFPDRFGDLTQEDYQDLVFKRETRKYYSGAFVHINHPSQGSFYGFTIYTATSSEELLTMEEVQSVFSLIDQAFQAGPITYTFDRYDTMARDHAREWTDPGFLIYFED